VKLGEQVSSADKDPVVALRTFEALSNACSVIAEPHIVLQLPAILAAAAHKLAPVRAAAEDAMKAFAAKLSVNAVPLVLKELFKACEVGVAWQTRALALKTIAGFADHAPEVLGFCLPEVVPQVGNTFRCSFNWLKSIISLLVCQSSRSLLCPIPICIYLSRSFLLIPHSITHLSTPHSPFNVHR
jgi:hypothetical protein